MKHSAEYRRFTSLVDRLLTVSHEEIKEREGPTGSPRTGIIDAVAFRLSRKNRDVLDLRLVQLKGGGAGVKGAEIARLKKAAGEVFVKWMVAEFDGQNLHLLSDDRET